MTTTNTNMKQDRSRAGENTMAYTAVLSRNAALPYTLPYTLGIAEEHKAGYVPYHKEGFFESYEAAFARAVELNAAMGLTLKSAYEIVASSMGAGSKR